MMDMQDKIAVVTGGTSGIGRAIVQRFLRHGARVVVGSIDFLGGSCTFEGATDRVTCIQMDVSRENDVESLIALTIERHGRIDIMVNNAGISGVVGSIAELPADAVRHTGEVLFNGVFHGVKHASKPMIAHGSGTIINISSITGLTTYINASHIYSAFKAAVIQLTKTAALELGPRGIRINCICPGFIATPIFGKALKVPEEKLGKSVEAAKVVFRDLQPLRRSGLPEDIANAAYWLASAEASFVTGHALVVDGGASCGIGWNPADNRFARIAAALAESD